MRQSKLFTKTRKEAPKDEVSKNAQLLIRAGYVHKEMAGIYSFLPLGLIVLKKIEQIVREEMNAIGGEEVHLTVLQDKNLWEKTGRWDDKVVDNWFKTKLKNDTELGLGFTHEEELTNLMRDYVRSFRDLPVYPYQIQTKFRNEARVKSGIMRGREFLMKDLYSFSLNEEQHATFYDQAKIAYMNFYRRVGLGDITYITYASGGSFSKFSHEFQTVSMAGEDTIYICEKCRMAVNEEIHKEQKTCPQCGNADLKKEKAVEVGNIFSLGTRFSDAFELNYIDEKGEKKPVIMGSYGIGLTRLLGTIVEVFADEGGIVWPESVAPFQIHLISIPDKTGGVQNYADKLYKALVDKGIEVLYDDRDMRAGEKFADSDLIGIPYRAVISEKNIAESKIEWKVRSAKNGDGDKGEVTKITEDQLFDLMKEKQQNYHGKQTKKNG